MNILIAYATHKGSTAEIADYVGQHLSKQHINYTIHNVEQSLTHLKGYDATLLITPIYKGLWLPEMTKFARQHMVALRLMPVWCLFPCIRVLEVDGIEYAYDNYLPTTLLDKLDVHEVQFTAGKLFKQRLQTSDEIELRERYDGNNLQEIDGDYRDWKAISRWVDTMLHKVR